MRSFFVGTLVLSVIGFFDCIPARAISLTLVSTAPVVAVGETVGVAVQIAGLGDGVAPSLSAFDIEVNFDPAILALSSISYGDPLLGDQLDLLGSGSIISTTVGFGVVGLSELSLDSSDILDLFQVGEFTLATITFVAVEGGVGLLGLTANALADANGDPLVAAISDGSIAVIPEPSTILLVGIPLAGLLVVRRKRLLLFLTAKAN
jgi:hypothetical protein